jgi:hypothetical protein
VFWDIKNRSTISSKSRKNDFWWFLVKIVKSRDPQNIGVFEDSYLVESSKIGPHDFIGFWSKTSKFDIKFHKNDKKWQKVDQKSIKGRRGSEGQIVPNLPDPSPPQKGLWDLRPPLQRRRGMSRETSGDLKNMVDGLFRVIFQNPDQKPLHETHHKIDTFGIYDFSSFLMIFGQKYIKRSSQTPILGPLTSSIGLWDIDFTIFCVILDQKSSKIIKNRVWDDRGHRYFRICRRALKGISWHRGSSILRYFPVTPMCRQKVNCCLTVFSV